MHALQTDCRSRLRPLNFPPETVKYKSSALIEINMRLSRC
jgi:hypothetical protein